MIWPDITKDISLTIGKEFRLSSSPQPLSGGCINQSYRLLGSDSSYFVKLNQANLVSMFNSEAAGLQEIASSSTIRVPLVVSSGISGNYSYLVLEWLDLTRGTSANWYKMGENLAKLHLISVGSNFGWRENNTIGSTPQINNLQSCWADFFANERIGYQLKLARGTFGDAGKIIQAVRAILREHQPQPSVVHGDLWSGNAGFTYEGEPIIFDPATYYGDREVDIAMSELFGGFPADFYRGYNMIAPLDSGYQQRKNLYNLYHLLNHFNLFGGSYQWQAQQIIQQLLRNS